LSDGPPVPPLPADAVAGPPGDAVAGPPGDAVAGPPGDAVAGPPGDAVAGLPGDAVAGPGVALAMVTAELYGLPPGAFTAAREARAAEARRAGDRALAAAIKKLRRPTTGAWLANLLVRRRHDQVIELLELGAVMREAQSQLAADDLRHLSRQRQQVVAALGREAVGLARAAGESVGAEAGRELEATLEAALADAAASEALRVGCLTKALQYCGLGPAIASGAAAGSAPAPAIMAADLPTEGPTDTDGDELAAARRRRQQEQLEAAAQARLEAEARVDAARRELDGAARHLAAAETLVAERAAQVQEVEARLADGREHYRVAVEEADTAAAARQAAEAQLRQAEDGAARGPATVDKSRG
jgi:hypothetical protein